VNLTLRSYSFADYPALLAIQQACFPPPYPADLLWTRAQVGSHAVIFPEAALLAVVDGQPAGSCTAHCLNWEPDHPDHTWRQATDDGYLRNHDVRGNTLYGVDLAVAPAYRRQGVARALTQAHHALVRERGLARYLAGYRLSGWHRHQHLDHAAYAAAVVRGDLSDPVVTPALRSGMTPVRVMPGYLPDEESGGAALLMCWTPGREAG
jgi:ribosomal protein S18 acetylase RimI-like enzyme